jgi:hypothetical protein
MTSPTRLPVQHPKRPHCPNCKSDLPNFNDVYMSMLDHVDYRLFAVTFHVRCKCGAAWDLRKECKL